MSTLPTVLLAIYTTFAMICRFILPFSVTSRCITGIISVIVMLFLTYLIEVTIIISFLHVSDFIQLICLLNRLLDCQFEGLEFGDSFAEGV